MRKLLFLLLCMIFQMSVQASGVIDDANTKEKKPHLVDIAGKVKDDFTGADLPAMITLMKADSTVLDTMHANIKSEYYYNPGYYFTNVPIEKGKYIVKATLEGYGDVYVNKDIRIVGRNRYFAFPLVKMHRKMDSYVHELGEVKVTGTMVKLVHKGDTLIYNAQAFKVPDGSMLDGLIRQLPGAELQQNGDILINGRKIENLTLNGDDFFKGNNQVMLQNLPYFTVDQVKVYNKQTDESRKQGRDVEPRQFTMDIVLKREYNRGYLANIQVAGGTKDRYNAQTFHLTYDDLNRFTLYGNMNNLNQNPRPGDQGDWKPRDMGDGEWNKKKAGLEFTAKEKEEKWKNRLTSEVSWTKQTLKKDTYRQQFMENGDIFSIQNAINKSSHFDWTAKDKLELGQNTTFNISANYHKQSNEDMLNDSTYTLEDRINLNSSLSGADKHKYDLTATIRQNITLPWGDLLTLAIDGKFGKEKFTNRVV